LLDEQDFIVDVEVSWGLNSVQKATWLLIDILGEREA
jgi:hypothetical protein